MKRLLKTPALMAGALAFSLLLGGCATTETRIAEHPELYNVLSERDKGLVAEGHIRQGMSRDAVYLAWGAPNQRAEGRNDRRPVETWIYFNTTAGDYYPGAFLYGPYAGFGYGYGYGGGFGYSRSYRHGRFRGAYAYDPFYDPFFYNQTSVVTYPERVVSFQNGRVISYQLLPAPRFF
jgi:hypothetical protein